MVKVENIVDVVNVVPIDMYKICLVSSSSSSNNKTKLTWNIVITASVVYYLHLDVVATPAVLALGGSGIAIH